MTINENAPSLQDQVEMGDYQLTKTIVSNALNNDVVNFKTNMSQLIQDKIYQDQRIINHENTMEKFGQYSDAFGSIN